MVAVLASSIAGFRRRRVDAATARDHCAPRRPHAILNALPFGPHTPALLVCAEIVTRDHRRESTITHNSLSQHARNVA